MRSAIPYVGFPLMDLEFVQDGSADYVSSGGINFGKRRRIRKSTVWSWEGIWWYCSISAMKVPTPDGRLCEGLHTISRVYSQWWRRIQTVNPPRATIRCHSYIAHSESMANISLEDDGFSSPASSKGVTQIIQCRTIKEAHRTECYGSGYSIYLEQKPTRKRHHANPSTTLVGLQLLLLYRSLSEWLRKGT